MFIAVNILVAKGAPQSAAISRRACPCLRLYRFVEEKSMTSNQKQTFMLSRGA
jgi:hypothetical protein